MVFEVGPEAAAGAINCSISYANITERVTGRRLAGTCAVVAGSATYVGTNNRALGVTTAPLESNDSRERAELTAPARSLEAMAFGSIASTASNVTVTQGSSSVNLQPTGYVSVGTGFCPAGTCPMTIEGVEVTLPNFVLNGTQITNGVLRSAGTWDGLKYADETYALFGTTVMATFANVNSVLQGNAGRAGPDEINGELRMVASTLPPPLMGTGRYATVSGSFVISGVPGGDVTLTVDLVVPLTTGGPVVTVQAIAQPPCGTEPCGGTTYNAASAVTFAGSPSVSYQWVDQLNRVVGTSATLDSDAVTNVSGSPTPWPVRLIVRDETAGGNAKPRTRVLVGPGTPSRAGEYYAQEDFGRMLTRGFLNRGNYEDIVVGTPNDATRPGTNAFGSVNVIFGGRPDARYGQDFRWTLPSGTVSDDFGSALAVGDFNGDGREDLAASAPGRLTSGAVYIAYQDTSTLSTTVPSGALGELLGSGAPGWIAGGSGFGTSLTAGDFNGDGADDLAVGTPSYNGSRGAVWVYYGKPGVGIVTGAGAVRAPHRILFGDYEPGLTGANLAFGWAVQASDYDGDGRDDLAIGIPRTATSASSTYVSVLYGTSTGITTAKRYLFTGLGRCGTSLAAGNFTADVYRDLAIGCPENNDGGTAAGAVYVLRGSSSLLGSVEVYRQMSSDAGGAGCRTAAANDRFGTTLAVARVDADYRDDLMVLGDASSVSRDMLFALRGQTATPTSRVFPVAAEQCFARSTFFNTGTASLGPAVTAADVTHDGLTDVIVGSFGDAGGRVDVLPAIPGAGLSTGGVYVMRQPTIL